MELIGLILHKIVKIHRQYTRCSNYSNGSSDNSSVVDNILVMIDTCADYGADYDVINNSLVVTASTNNYSIQTTACATLSEIIDDKIADDLLPLFGR